MKKLTFFILFAAFALAAFSQPVEKYHRVKVYAANVEQIQTISLKGISMESLEHKPGDYYIAEYSDSEVELLKTTGVAFEILISDLSTHYQKQNEGISVDELNRSIKKSRNAYFGYPTPANFSLGSMGGYHTYTELLQELDNMRTLFPTLISQKIPASQTQTVEGRTVYFVRISNNPDVEQSKPKVLYTALTHAREPMGMQQMLFQMWYLLENYSTDPEIRYLVDNLEIYFIPCVNPDGYIYNQSTNPNGGGMWRKNRKDNDDGSFGVDLNRNFGFMWGYDDNGSSPVTSSQTYRGTAPFSEPETQIVKEFCESRQILLALNNHTYSNLLIYPYGYANVLTPDSLVFMEYAKRMTQLNGYRYGTCYQTLNYTANGGSDDWLYGEQTTKNKIFAFTPEAGHPSDGFWPAAGKIEETCAGHSEMNLFLLRFALPYAEVEDMSAPAISSLQFTMPLKIKTLGQADNASFTVSLVPLSNKVISVSEPQVFSNMQTLNEQVGEFNIELKSNTAQGTPISFIVRIDNGLFVYTDTITKFYGSYVSTTDACETMTNWVSTTWNITSGDYVSPSHSITDSPSGNYTNNANTTITYAQVVDLTAAADAYVEFYARWHIEEGYDYVQFQVSENGNTWVSLPGRYTNNGSQDSFNPLWEGQSNWVQERISLNNFLGKNIRLRFRLISDGSVTYDGFYFDDFSLHLLPKQLEPEFMLPENFSFNQGETLAVDFEDFVTAYSYDNLELSWSGNNWVTIDADSWIVNFGVSNPDWYGEETIEFVLTYPQGQITKQTVVEVRQLTGISAAYHAPEVYFSVSAKRIYLKSHCFSSSDECEIYTLHGQKIIRTDITTLVEGLDVSHLPRGVYLVRFPEHIAKLVLY